jgi:putative transposase
MTEPVSYKRHRFPPQIIAHAVWLYFRFLLSLRLIEEMLLKRGIVVPYEAVRRWALKFGPAYACRLKRKPPSRHDIWHLDEVVVTIPGQKHWLWGLSTRTDTSLMRSPKPAATARRSSAC